MVIPDAIGGSASEYSFRSHLRNFPDAIVRETAVFFTLPEIK
jgi:hypothetical protein